MGVLLSTSLLGFLFLLGNIARNNNNIKDKKMANPFEIGTISKKKIEKKSKETYELRQIISPVLDKLSRMFTVSLGTLGDFNTETGIFPVTYTKDEIASYPAFAEFMGAKSEYVDRLVEDGTREGHVLLKQENYHVYQITSSNARVEQEDGSLELVEGFELIWVHKPTADAYRKAQKEQKQINQLLKMSK